MLLLRRPCNYSKQALAAGSHAEAIVEVSQMHLALGLGEQHEEAQLQLAHAGQKTSDFRSREWHAGWARTACLFSYFLDNGLHLVTKLPNGFIRQGLKNK